MYDPQIVSQIYLELKDIKPNIDMSFISFVEWLFEADRRLCIEIEESISQDDFTRYNTLNYMRSYVMDAYAVCQSFIVPI